MAYIEKQRVKQVRETLKQLFPKSFKFSVERLTYSKVSISLMESPLAFSKSNMPINEYYLNKAEHSAFWKIVKDIVNVGNHDNSNSMEDYYDVGFYIDLSVGKWNKPYKQTK